MLKLLSCQLVMLILCRLVLTLKLGNRFMKVDIELH